MRIEGRLYCPKLTATIFPAPHALPESYHSSKMSSMYPPLEHGQDFVTNLPIKGNERDALGLLRLDHKGGHSFCPTSLLSLLEPTQLPNCEEAQTHTMPHVGVPANTPGRSISCRHYQLTARPERGESMRGLHAQPLSDCNLMRDRAQGSPGNPQN